MKKVMNLVIGGLQQKIFNLVLITILLLMAVYTAVIVYQTVNIQHLVTTTNEKQQASIQGISDQTMDAVITESLGTSTKMQAYIADNVFGDLKSNVELLGDYAGKLLLNPDNYPIRSVSAPNSANDGVVSVQLMTEEGVDLNDAKVADDIGLIGNMSDVMESLFMNANVNSCFVATTNGVILIADDRAGAKISDDGTVGNFPFSRRPWYIGAKESKSIYFTDVEEDAFTGQIGIVCSMPVYVDGKLRAVVGADLFLDSMAEAIKDSGNGTDNFSFIVKQNGHIIFSPEAEGIFEAKESSNALDLRQSENDVLAEFVTKALNGNTDVKCISVGGSEYYMAGAPLDTVGWAIISVVDKEVTRQPALTMQNEYDEINHDAIGELIVSLNKGRTALIILIVIVLLAATIGSLLVAKRIVKPLNTITKRVASLGGNNLRFVMEDTYRTGDEIEVLAESFSKLSAKTLKYVDEVTRVTAEKERIGAELTVATRIQESMLPNIFPAFPERSEFDIYASMTPAKEVGGDFYDFFIIDNDHLGLVMADVSGKGVPAALFMMMAKIIIANNAMMGLSPCEVLEKANTQICQNNEAEMFVTVWFGILTISTGNVVAANAGHEYPIIKGEDGEFKLYKDKHGFVVGGMDGVKYKEYEFNLSHGGTLFLYTDGVAEATDANDELFGTDRTLKALNSAPDASPKELLANVQAAVDEFVGEAPQFDDLTMLAVKWK